MHRDLPVRNVFISLVAQHENLGDLFIRREMIRWLSIPGIMLHVLTKDIPSSFVAAAEIPLSAVTYQSYWSWEAALLRSALKGNSGLVFAPGPQVLLNSPSLVLHEVVNLSNVLALRLRRNPIAKIGRSLRGDGWLAVPIEQAIHDLSDIYWVRDTSSAATINRGLSVLPDIALSERRGFDDERRDWVSISPHVGRRWNIASIRRLASESANCGLRVGIVTQTRFDEPFHAWLAAGSGVEHLAWGTRSHRAQLLAVEERYSQSVAVASDRLHALLIGMSCGATPIPLVHADLKIGPTLQALGWPSIHPSVDAPVDSWVTWRTANQREQALLLDEAAKRLNVARVELSRRLSP